MSLGSVTDGTEILDAEALGQRTDALACFLAARGIGPGDRVGIGLDRSVDLVVALRAVHRAGAAFVPLDPGYPPARLRVLVDDARPALILSASRVQLGDRLGGGGHACPIVHLDRQAAEIAACPGPPPPGAPADALAYVIFTSGSTGRPKGVMVERGQLDRFFGAMDAVLDEPDPSGPRTWAAVTSVSFDISILELLYTVERGYRLVVVPQDQQAPPALARVFQRHAVTHFQCTPSLAGALIEDPAMRAALGALRCHLVGGEALPAPLARELRGLGAGRVINMYGPTEATIWSTCHVVDEEEPVPIGRPLGNTTVHVVDETLRPVPPGTPGELLLGGSSVARGYLGDPELTRQRFCDGPGGERVYRTGDVVKQRPDGALLFIGRRDQQVKIRGHRIELGEVEAALVEHPAVSEAAAVACGEPSPRLVAYVAPRPGRACDPEDVRERLRSRLPEHAVPSVVVVLARLPRTPNGKIDRNALPAPPAVRADAPAGELPRGPTPEGPDGEPLARLARLVGAALRTEPPGRDARLLQLGVDSLMAMRLLTAMHAELGVELSVREFFEADTIGQLAARIAHERAAPAAPTAPASAAPAVAAPASAWPTVAPRPEARHDPFPLNEVQQAYWMGRSREYELGGLSMHSFVELELPDLDVPRLERALAAVIARHDMLRAIVAEDGTQRVLAEVPAVRIPVTDLRPRSAADAEAWLAAERERLAHQILPLTSWPLFELCAVHVSEGRWRVLVSLDGIMNDAGSVHIAVSELVRLYRDPGGSLPPLELSFRDYVQAELEHHGSEAYRRSWEYWRERLGTLPSAPELPVSIPAGVPRFSRRTGSLPAAAWRELRQRASRSGLTPSGCLLAAYAEILASFAKQSRLLVNITLFNRLPVHRSIEGVVGDFTSLILLEVDGSRSRSFAERALAAQTQLWRDLDHRRVSGVRILRELARAHPGRALAPVVFTSTLGGGAYAMAGHGALPEERGGLTQTPQVLLDNMVGESAAGDLVWTWDAVEAAFPPGLLDAMAASFRGLLERLAGDELAWSEIGRAPVAVPVPAAPPPAPAPPPPASATPPAPPARRLEDGVPAQLADRGRQTAVVAGLRRIGFAELHGRARQVENLLVGHGVRPGDRVAIVMRKGWEQVVAALAILRAGAAYVPLDPEWPEGRIARLLERCEIRVVLTRAQERLHLPGGAVRIDVDGVPPMRDAGALPGASRDPDALAYVIFTSGSTGEPKGVMISHRGALNTIDDINRRFAIGPADRIFGISALSFDLSVYDVFGTLAAGARLILPEPEHLREPSAWLELMAREGVTVWSSVPALMEMLVSYLDELGAPSPDVPLRLVLLSGDWIPVDLPDRVRRHFPGARVVSLGGATEASIWSIAYPIDRVDPAWRSIPYGRSLHGQSVQVLDDAYVPRPAGVPGELYIGGVGLALGYLGDPAQTAARFVVSPRTGERLYRTGDWGRLLPDGEIEFLGRDDRQVKIGGNRIELGELEVALARHPHVAQVIALAIGAGSHRRLVAFAVPHRESQRGPGLLTGDLARAAFKLEQPGLRRDDGLQRLALAEDAAAADWRAAARRRRTERRFARRSVGLPDLGRLLEPLRHVATEGPLPKLRYPSAGSLYPVQVYLHVKAGQAVPEGVYYHDPARHELVLLRARPAIGPSMYTAINQDAFAEAAFAIFLMADRRAIEPLYGRRSRDLSLIEAGHIGQLLMEQAGTCGLGLCPIGDLDADALGRELSLGEDHGFLYGFLGGASLSIPAARLADELIALAAETLPAYMVPAEVRVIETVPLSSNGKVDRSALERLAAEPLAAPPPASDRAAPAGATGSAAMPPAQAGGPRAEIAAHLLEIWRRVLRRPDLPRDAHFFEQGGNSLSATQVIAAVRAMWAVQVPLRSLFDHPALEAFAERVAALVGATPRDAASKPATIPRRPR